MFFQWTLIVRNRINFFYHNYFYKIFQLPILPFIPSVYKIFQFQFLLVMSTTEGQTPVRFECPLQTDRTGVRLAEANQVKIFTSSFIITITELVHLFTSCGKTERVFDEQLFDGKNWKRTFVLD